MNLYPGHYLIVVTLRKMAEAVAKRKRQAATDKLKVVADLVTALVNRNVVAAMRPSTTGEEGSSYGQSLV